MYDVVEARTPPPSSDAEFVLDRSPEAAFDDLCKLAAELCGGAMAIVSLLDRDRMWFKARLGFDQDSLALSDTICQHGLRSPGLLVIEDLSADPRTCANPFVAGEPGVRFYAGAPLRGSGGEVFGALCVLDGAPRPGGLTPGQAAGLERLARQVVDQIELRRALAAAARAQARQQAAQAELAAGEARWRGLFEQLEEGFILGRPVRDGQGRVVDWTYLEVNPAWTRLVGRPADEVVGRTVREVLPGIEQVWIDLATVVDQGGAISFTRQVGQLGRWYEGRARAIGPDEFVVMFLEVTERLEAEREVLAGVARKLALAELADALRASRDVAAMSRAAGAATGRMLGARQAGYGEVDLAEERVSISADWCAPGAPSLAGEHAFRVYGGYIDELKAGRTVCVADVERDPRTAGQAEAFRAIGVRAFVNVPILEQGEFVGVSFAHFGAPRALTAEEESFVFAAVDRTRASVARARAEERQAVVNGEISHRLKNTLALVQALAAQTFRGKADPDVLRLFEDRLGALAAAQDALMRGSSEAVDLRELLRRGLDGVAGEGRYRFDGPEVGFGPAAALTASLLLHELATNACKYGALSAPGGRVEVSWGWSGAAGAETLRLDWREVGGPPVSAPASRGFGSRLLRMGLAGVGDAEIDYDPSGLHAAFTASRRQIERP